MANILESAKELLELHYFESDLLQQHFQQGEGSLIVSTGDNASGKSFFARLMQAWVKEYHGWGTVNVSMNTRKGNGRIGLSSFMYMLGGDEAMCSTGAISVSGVQSTVEQAAKHDQPHILIFDEVEIGLSDGFQSALGAYIADVCSHLGPMTQGVVVVSHSRRLLRELLLLNPHYVNFGDAKTLREYVETEQPSKSIEELLDLPRVSIERMRSIEASMQR